MEFFFHPVWIFCTDDLILIFKLWQLSWSLFLSLNFLHLLQIDFWCLPRWPHFWYLKKYINDAILFFVIWHHRCMMFMYKFNILLLNSRLITFSIFLTLKIFTKQQVNDIFNLVLVEVSALYCLQFSYIFFVIFFYELSACMKTIGGI